MGLKLAPWELSDLEPKFIEKYLIKPPKKTTPHPNRCRPLKERWRWLNRAQREEIKGDSKKQE
ncbi:hypothetical protein GsuE55_37100 (plasmid) [Geobacillus subterraneus]|uniref:Uncharacterized protein n=1 Tax=Geobacillus subterraneus TaxID=129338 RepID=A0A679FXN1_9BACL|nr:hypothetical protein GsuE55_37100 [Geobacillus subterraneus]